MLRALRNSWRLLALALRFARHDALFPLERREERLLFLPLCHVAERLCGYYFSVATGSIPSHG